MLLTQKNKHNYQEGTLCHCTSIMGGSLSKMNWGYYVTHIRMVSLKIGQDYFRTGKISHVKKSYIESKSVYVDITHSGQNFSVKEVQMHYKGQRNRQYMIEFSLREPKLIAKEIVIKEDVPKLKRVI